MSKKNINVFTPFFRTDEILGEIEECLEKGWTGMGFKTQIFEDKWSEYTGIPYSHFLSSNTVGLHLAVRLLKITGGWQDGDEIITTPLTFVSTNHSILYENLKPVFADVDEYLTLDPRSVEQKITSKTKAVMFVGIGGNPGRLDQITELCRKYDIKLILDAAHMSGTRVRKGIHVGQEADVTVFSFQAVKNLPTADSGMICFRNKELHELATKLSWLGIDKTTFSRAQKGSYKWKYDVPHLGYKYHGNSIMAAIGLVQLKYLDEDNSKRNDICEKYYSSLDKLNGIELIRDSEYCFKSSKHLFQVLVKDSPNGELRDKYIEELNISGIYPGVHYIDNTNYTMFKYAHDDCPNASMFSNRLISLPLHLRLTDSDQNYIINTVKELSGKL